MYKYLYLLGNENEVHISVVGFYRGVSSLKLLAVENILGFDVIEAIVCPLIVSSYSGFHMHETFVPVAGRKV